MNTNAAINYTGLNIGTLVLIGIGAVITIFAMIWGTMRRRAKAAAIAESELHEQAILAAEAHDGGAFGAAAEVDPTPEPAAMPVAPAMVPTAPAGPDDTGDAMPGAGFSLTTLKGLGPRAASALAEQGITGIGDLAALDPARADAIDAQLGPLAGRIARDRWVEQARLLVAGDLKGFEAAFGKIGD